MKKVLLSGLFFLFFACAADSGGVFPPASMSPGDVAFIRIEHDDREPVTGVVAGKKVVGAYRFSNGFGALFGVDVAARAGDIRLRVMRKLPLGQTVERSSVMVGKKKFPELRVRGPKRTRAQRAEIAQNEMKLELVFGKRGTPPPLWTSPFANPLSAIRVRRGGEFGTVFRTHENLPRVHEGVDLEAPSGTPVFASNAGTVVLAERLFLEGRAVIIDHGDGLYTVYAHLGTIAVGRGTVVRRGAVIGTVGESGATKGANLHFAVRMRELRVDPLKFIEASIAAGERIPE